MRLAPDGFDQVFEGGQLPILLYANRQNYGGAKHDRPMHRHEALCELLLCYRGFGVYHVNNQRYPLQEGDVIYYNAGELHEVLSESDTEIGTYCFGFADVRLRGLPPHHCIPPDSPHVRASGSQYDFLRQLAEQILARFDGREPDRLNAQLMGVSLLLAAAQLQAAQNEPPLTDTAAALTESVREYIDTHFTESFRLEDIAEKLHCSTSYIAHTFKRVTGYSPIQYTIRRRIGLAQTLLISSDLPATQIATMVGYDNTNYFHSLFTRVVGATPIQYRKNYLESLRGNRDQL